MARFLAFLLALSLIVINCSAGAEVGDTTPEPEEEGPPPPDKLQGCSYKGHLYKGGQRFIFIPRIAPHTRWLCICLGGRIICKRITPQTVCIVNGVRHPYGSYWKRGCHLCKCIRTGPFCYNHKCLGCTDAQGTKYAALEVFKQGCKKCICLGGKIRCSSKDCDQGGEEEPAGPEPGEEGPEKLELREERESEYVPLEDLDEGDLEERDRRDMEEEATLEDRGDEDLDPEADLAKRYPEVLDLDDPEERDQRDMEEEAKLEGRGGEDLDPEADLAKREELDPELDIDELIAWR